MAVIPRPAQRSREGPRKDRPCHDQAAPWPWSTMITPATATFATTTSCGYRGIGVRAPAGARGPGVCQPPLQHRDLCAPVARKARDRTAAPNGRMSWRADGRGMFDRARPSNRWNQVENGGVDDRACIPRSRRHPGLEKQRVSNVQQESPTGRNHDIPTSNSQWPGYWIDGVGWMLKQQQPG